VKDLKVTEEYRAEKDVAFYEGAAGRRLVMTRGSVAVFYPGDAHAPGLMHEGMGTVGKCVIKIRHKER
jgi:YhcH/YjgK/YiaL family protein